MYNPFTNYRVTDTWVGHLLRGSAGGIDYAMPVGTPLPACSDGTIVNTPYNGTGGHTVTIYRTDGTRTQYMHLSKFTTPRKVREGEIIGYSGGARGTDGSGSSTGPHLHAHDITARGVRVPPFTSSTIRPAILATIQATVNGASTMKLIYLKGTLPPGVTEDTRRVLVDGFNFQPITAAQSLREGKLWGKTINFTPGEYLACKDLVNQRRISAGMSAL